MYRTIPLVPSPPLPPLSLCFSPSVEDVEGKGAPSFVTRPLHRSSLPENPRQLPSGLLWHVFANSLSAFRQHSPLI